LGNFYARRGYRADAEAEYKAALRLSPQFMGAAVNLADLYRQSGREGEGEAVLRTAIAASPRDAGLHYALGLTLTRLKRPGHALEELRHAVELDPDQARYAYVYSVALHSAGRADEAMTALRATLVRHPSDRDTLNALITFSRDAGDFRSALDYAERLARTAPDDANIATIVQRIRSQIENSMHDESEKMHPGGEGDPPTIRE
jgi:Flp pilus assembly protein TadD